jgi:hypothetical protein
MNTTRGPGYLTSSFDGTRSIEVVGLLLTDDGRATHTLAVGQPTRAAKFGKEVVAVPSTLTPKSGPGDGVIRQTSYFDPANAFVYLGSEAAEPATDARPWPQVTVCALEFESRPSGPPVPRRFTRHVQPAGGGRLLEYEVEYTRFEDYEPGPEEFRLEERYGLTTPTGPDGRALVGVRPPSRTARTWVWGAVLAGAGLLGVAGFAVYRRRRAARARPPRPERATAEPGGAPDTGRGIGHAGGESPSGPCR